MWCKVAYPKFPTVYNASSSLLELLSHLPPPPMHLLTWFFLLWPFATIYYHLGLSNSLLPHWESYKSLDTAIFSTTVLNTHCKSISLIIYIISIRFWANSGCFSADNLILRSSESFSLFQSMFWCFIINLYFLINLYLYF